MSTPNIEIDKAKRIAVEMENSLSYFRTFIGNMEKYVASASSEQQSPAPETISVEAGVGQAPQKPDMYTIKSLAAELRVSERTIRRYCNEGLIGYMHIRGKIRFSLKDVEEFYRANYREKF